MTPLLRLYDAFIFGAWIYLYEPVLNRRAQFTTLSNDIIGKRRVYWLDEDYIVELVHSNGVRYLDPLRH